MFVSGFCLGVWVRLRSSSYKSLTRSCFLSNPRILAIRMQWIHVLSRSALTCIYLCRRNTHRGLLRSGRLLIVSVSSELLTAYSAPTFVAVDHPRSVLMARCFSLLRDVRNVHRFTHAADRSRWSDYRLWF
jgi:hypothetical protein